MNTAPAGVGPAETMTDPRVREPLELATASRRLTVTRENKVQAEEAILALNQAEKRAREVLDPICDANYKAWKTATDKRAEVLKPIEDARAYLRRECAGVQRVLDQEARLEAERRAAETKVAEQKRLEAEAESIADAGDVETAIEVLAEAQAVEAPAVATVLQRPAQASGLTYRDNWKYEFVDAKGRPTKEPDLSLIPVQYHRVDDTAIGGTVRALKGRTNIPGIRVFNDRQPVGSGGRR